jgi:hypothetical protein
MPRFFKGVLGMMYVLLDDVSEAGVEVEFRDVEDDG